METVSGFLHDDDDDDDNDDDDILMTKLVKIMAKHDDNLWTHWGFDKMATIL